MVSVRTSSNETERSVDMVAAENSFLREMEYTPPSPQSERACEGDNFWDLAMKGQIELQASREEYARLSNAYTKLREQYAEALDVAGYLSDRDIEQHVELTNLAAQNNALRKRLKLQVAMTAAASILIGFLVSMISTFLK